MRELRFDAGDVAEIFGVSASTVRRWAAGGLLASGRRRPRRFTERSVVRFIVDHPERYSLARVDQFMFRALVYSEMAKGG